MTSSRTASLALSLSLALSACAMSPDHDDDDQLGEDRSAITSGGWQPSSHYTGVTYRGAQVAYLDGIDYVVRVGSCGSWTCGSTEDEHNLTWASFDSTGAALHGDNVTAGASWQGADSKVSLAAFNGYLYMLHTGADSSSDTYLSRFDPATQLWNQRKIAISSFQGPAALAAYNGKLYFIGINSSYNIWYATMDTAENISAINVISGYTSQTRISATVGFGKLWIAHRQGGTHNIVYNTFDGASWSGTSYIYGGDSNGVLQGDEPVIAYDAGFLRLVHQRPGSGYLWTTTYNGCAWATAETSIGASLSSSLPPSLAQSANGLALVTEAVNSNTLGPSYVSSLRFYDHPTYTVPCTIITNPQL